MKALFGAFLVAHGLIHFLGTAKAFGLGDLDALSQPISRGMGVLWAVAGAGMLASALMLLTAPRAWWLLAAAAALLSQAAILGSWGDAKVGTLANLVVLVAVAHAVAVHGPAGLRRAFGEHVTARLPVSTPRAVLSEADLVGLPEPVQRYLRVSGAVGQPQVGHFTVRLRGRIREGPDDSWMEFTSVQHNFVDPPARFFLMDARRRGLPVDVLHVYEDGRATMRVRLLSLFGLVDARGPELDRAETVTLLNDLALFAPGALVGERIRWEPIDERTARASYTVGTNTVRAELHFDDDGHLVDFVSDDRLRASSDGERFTALPWSTPISGYDRYGPLRLMSRGEARWHPAGGSFAYLEVETLSAVMNGHRP